MAATRFPRIEDRSDPDGTRRWRRQRRRPGAPVLLRYRLAWARMRNSLFVPGFEEIRRYFASLGTEQLQAELIELCQRERCTDIRLAGRPRTPLATADIAATTPDGRRILIRTEPYGYDNALDYNDVWQFDRELAELPAIQAGVMVTRNRTTRSAATFARKTGIALCGRRALAAWLTDWGPAPWSSPDDTPGPADRARRG